SPCRIVIRPRAPFVRGDHCVASSEVVELALQCAEAPSAERAPETGGDRARWAVACPRRRLQHRPHDGQPAVVGSMDVDGGAFVIVETSRPYPLFRVVRQTCEKCLLRI